MLLGLALYFQTVAWLTIMSVTVSAALQLVPKVWHVDLKFVYNQYSFDFPVVYSWQY
jgi:hypothetical protein